MASEKSVFTAVQSPFNRISISHMTHTKKLSLRARAERELAKSFKGEIAKDSDTLHDRCVELHELHVHQIELEMQNDELQLAYLSLAQSRAQYVQLYDKAPVGYCTILLDASISQVNASLCSMLGMTSDAMLKLKLTDIVFRDDQDVLYKTRRRLGRSDKAESCQLRLKRLDTSLLWVQLQIVFQAMHDGEGEGVLNLAIIDIEQRKKIEDAQVLAASVFVNAREGIMITDKQAKILVVNEAFSRITGYSSEEVIGKSPNLLKSGLQSKEFYFNMWSELKTFGHAKVDLWNRKKSGELFSVAQTMTVVLDEFGEVKNYVALFSDVTQLKRQEEQLKHIAHYDTLTNLPNRLLLADRLSLAMMQAKRSERMVAVAFLDLDGFKSVNDVYGHDVGDQLLVALSQNMEAEMREGDTLARFGGDEFVVVIGNLESVEASLSVLDRLLFASNVPFFTGLQKVQITSSIGVSFYPQLEEVDADQLMRQADQAMYQAKLEGKNQYHIFDAELDRTVRSYHQSVVAIKNALIAKEFILHFQPKVNMRKGELVGVEALIRWQHPERGLLFPCEFLPVIENHELMIEIGEWVIVTVLRQMRDWQTHNIVLPVSVNIGARHLQQADFVERLSYLLALYPEVNPALLNLEILETSPLLDMHYVTRVLTQCHELGVSFALDDFGTGYSSFSYLKRLPVGQLKIDQSFVRDMLKNNKDVAILKGVIALALAFSCEVIAEGVETEEQELILLELGCDMAQGFSIGVAMAAPDLLDWIAHWQPKSIWQKRLS